MVNKNMATIATFASALAVIALLAGILIILGKFQSVEGLDQQLVIVYAYSKSCPHCKADEARKLVDSFGDAAKACTINLQLDLLEVNENPSQAQALDVDATPTIFTKINGATKRLDDGSIGGLRAFLESHFAECSKEKST